MNRDPALQQLSRDHQHALAVALELTRATEATVGAARARFLDFWHGEGREHLREEEQVLLPALARAGDPDDPIIARVLIDHGELRRGATALAGRAPVSPATLRAVGERLRDHVRREERQLFPLIESAHDDATLRAVAARLAGSY